MNSQDYKKMHDIIENNRSFVDFSDYGDGVDLECIDKAQRSLDVLLPDSYKWWLLNYGGGEIGGEEIFSVYDLDFDNVSGGDIVKMYEISKNNGVSNDLIPICHSDIDGVFYFKFESNIQGNEYSIFSQATGCVYANNFLDFLEKRIKIFS